MKRQQLLDTALALFVANGVQATSTASIAREAGVATGTLFHHFASKQALIDTLYLEAKQDLAQVLSSPLDATALPEQLRQLWERALAWATSHPSQLKLMLQLSHDPAYPISRHQDLMLTTMGFIGNRIEQAQQQGLLAPLPMPLVLNFFRQHFLSTAQLFIEQPELARQAQYQQGAFHILWQGLQPLTHLSQDTAAATR
ncbi:TetR/AcrR family transcriptional regulator [Photobacterium gaetbulicola]|uniref:TetR family transcriptional regulator n=1 Tax=Photobacterium gaetbulicola Gung47 TaxID=658445 RepID=A0A0C5WVK1_9GAMM|nr:TetR/AcrR family transcriptional regulator [Photobacterium gaetbulicola]AJR07130.1 TetR family transcriptional regulator [Photobacterium gaetbulicola Gung47]PSU13824.1 TetR/AcrR family transcriptional regulator [Photobacterium gaetbulicola]